MLKGLLPPNADHPGYLASFVYPLFRGLTTNAAVAAINTIYFVPFVLARPLNFDRGYVYVTAGGAGSAVKTGIYADSPLTNRPVGAPLFADNTGAATTGTGKVTLALGSGRLEPGVIYWFGTKYTGTLPTITQTSGSDLEPQWLAGLPDTQADLRITLQSVADTYTNNMPTILEGAAFSVNNASSPLIWLRAA